MQLEPSIIIGGMILGLLCFADYRQKVTRIGNKTAYYFFLAVFLSLNLAVYWFLCQFFAEPLFRAMDSANPGSSAEAVKAVASKDLFASAEAAADLVPIILAFGYFGMGAQTMRWGKVEVSLYGKLLDMVQSLLPAKVSVWTDVRKAIREGDLQRQKMLDHLNDLRSIAPGKKWDMLEDQWQDVEIQCNQLDQRCAMLEKHLEMLNSEKLDREKIEWLKSDTLENVKESQKRALNLYKDYLADFICVNLRDEGEIRRVLNEIGIPHQEAETPTHISVPYRCLVSGVMAGLLLGPIIKLSDLVEDGLPFLALQGALSVSVMALIFSALHKRFNNLLYVLFIGAVGGYLGYFIFDLMQPTFRIGSKTIDKVLLEAMTGSYYGGGIAALLMAYRRWVAPRLKNVATGVAVLGLGGALLLWCTFTHCKADGIDLAKNASDLTLLAAGFVIAVFLGYGLAFFGEEKTPLNAEPEPAD